jgi:hypothetical protein
MSAEDTAAATKEVTPIDGTAPAATENGTATAAATTNGEATTSTDPKKGGNKRNNRKDYNKDDDKPEVPIEELFDLTKPIPRVSELYFLYEIAVY